MSDYCEIPEFYHAKWVRARKEHPCVECSSPILKGEFHGVFTGKWGGEIGTHRQHIECEDACRFIRDHLQSGECIAFGELRSIAGDYYRDSKEFRRIYAHVRWRCAKKRPLSFIPKYYPEVLVPELHNERELYIMRRIIK